MSRLNRARRGILTAGGALALVLAFVSRLVAFTAQDAFKPISEVPQAPSVSAPQLLLAAYALVWLFVVAFVWSMWRRLGTLEHELAEARSEFTVRKGGRS